MKKTIMLLIAAVIPAVASWCAVGETFTAEVPLGDGTVTMTFTITSDEPDAKVCQVGTGSVYGTIDANSAGGLVIPEKVAGYTVTSIGSNAFVYCSKLTSVIIPDGVTSIGDNAFHSCSNLTSITIPDGVTSIESHTFFGCSGLTTITIPESVISIGESVFTLCSSLTSIDIPENVASIENYAFEYCSSLTSITIPDGVTSIGNSTFHGCSGLTSIEIPASVTSIGSCAFQGCSGLTSIEIPANVTSIGDHAFSSCTGLTTITIPEGVTSIEANLFSYCSSLASVNILGNVTSIGYAAFSSCNALEYIDMSKSEIVNFLRDDAYTPTYIPTETLVFLPESKASSITGDKYIVSVGSDGTGTIAELTLTEGRNFNTPYTINANTVTNNRTFAPSEENAYTLCLPYDMTVSEGMTAYEPDNEDNGDGGSLVFKEVADGELKAYTPYLVTVSGENVSLNAVNAIVGATPTEPEAVTAGRYLLYGTTRMVDNATAAGMGAYILQAGNTWKPVSATNTDAYVMPGRAYLVPSADVTGAKEVRTVFDNETTGIGTIKTVSRDGTTRFYDLNGRRINGKAKGVYIMDGKKYVSPAK